MFIGKCTWVFMDKKLIYELKVWLLNWKWHDEEFYEKNLVPFLELMVVPFYSEA